MNIQETGILIENSLKGLKLDPVTCRGEKAGQWSFKSKDATIWIDVFSFPTNPDKFYFQVMSPLCKVPDTKSAEFFQDLLEINYQMYGSWMCKKEGWIYVLSLREAAGLNQSEVDAALDRVSFYSTDYYGKLSFKYQGCWIQKPPASNVDNEPGPGLN